MLTGCLSSAQLSSFRFYGRQKCCRDFQNYANAASGVDGLPHSELRSPSTQPSPVGHKGPYWALCCSTWWALRGPSFVTYECSCGSQPWTQAGDREKMAASFSPISFPKEAGLGWARVRVSPESDLDQAFDPLRQPREELEHSLLCEAPTPGTARSCSQGWMPLPGCGGSVHSRVHLVAVSELGKLY